MIRIDTTIEPRVVEIDDREYAVAPRTIEVEERLLEVARKYTGKSPAYKGELAELRVLLGEAACRELFAQGDRENVDRIDRIYFAVVRVYKAEEEEREARDVERKAQQAASALAPVNELMRNARALNAMGEGEGGKGPKEIRRG